MQDFLTSGVSNNTLIFAPSLGVRSPPPAGRHESGQKSWKSGRTRYSMVVDNNDDDSKKTDRERICEYITMKEMQSWAFDRFRFIQSASDDHDDD